MFVGFSNIDGHVVCVLDTDPRGSIYEKTNRDDPALCHLTISFE
jgi:hypothetical protein